MKRKELLRVGALVMLGLLWPLLVCDSAQAQKRGRRAAAGGYKVVSGDWRYPEIVAKESTDSIDLGDGFKADHLDGQTVTVYIPGAYSDTLERGSHTTPSLSIQLAAAVFIKVNSAATVDVGSALKNYYLGAKDVRHGNGEVETEYSFRLGNGRTSHIFVYFNNDYGLLGIVRTGPAGGK